MTTVEVTQADVTRELDRAIDRIMSIEIEAMGGDNLAVSLCSYFDRDDDSEPDDNGWSQSATDAYDEIKKEIAGLFVPVREKLTAFARHRIAATPPDALQTVVEALREARRIIADIDEYMKRPGCGDWGEECACCMGELLDDDREAIAHIDAALSLAGGDV